MSCAVKARSEIIRSQDRKGTYNVTLRIFRANIVVVEKQYLLQILSMLSLMYPACNAVAQYCYCGLSDYTVYFHIIS
jgi:hypothetical protein